MIIILQDLLTDFMKKEQFGEYTELRGQNDITMGVTLVDGILNENTRIENGGVSARIYKEGNYGFASAPDYSEEGIRKVLKAARENALFLYERGGLRKPAFLKFSSLERKDGYEHETTPTQRYMIDFARKIDEYIKGNCSNLLSRTIVATVSSSEKIYRNTDDVLSCSIVPRSQIGVFLTMMGTDGTPVRMTKMFGGFGSFEKLHTDPAKYFSDIEKTYRMLTEKAEGVYAQPGIKDVILDSDLAGILAHEAIGHTTEADFVRAGSIAGRLLGQQVGSELVTLVDAAHHVQGQLCPVPVFVDDEGVEAEDVTIIEKGVLKSFMHNKESAQDMGFRPQGNARANEYMDEPLIRMRNTCIMPGTSKLEDMISSIEDGYYFLNTSNGQADSTAEFMFGVSMGYEIKNGKLGKAVKDTTISGMAFDVLKNTSMISDELTWLSGGWCGKKQVIRVGMGGPSIKTRVNVGGR